jgi:uncharacterized protein (TIGR02466 family)
MNETIVQDYGTLDRKIKEPIVHGIFPVPILFKELDRSFTKDELAFVKKSGKDTYNNMGNITSNNVYILDTPEFAGLKKDLLAVVQYYFDKVMMADPKRVQPYITQSWLNFTEKGQFHHKHQHPNSIISGVLYFDADIKNDKLHFYKEGYQQLTTITTDFNHFNSTSWWFPVGTGMVTLFPSSTTHMVEVKQGTNRRTSLAFNTFIKGAFGEKAALTELLNP